MDKNIYFYDEYKNIVYKISLSTHASIALKFVHVYQTRNVPNTELHLLGCFISNLLIVISVLSQTKV